MGYVTFTIDHETETIAFGLPTIKGIAATKNNRLKSFEPDYEPDYGDFDMDLEYGSELLGCDPLEFAGDCY